jgi:hypothetical protein
MSNTSEFTMVMILTVKSEENTSCTNAENSHVRLNAMLHLLLSPCAVAGNKLNRVTKILSIQRVISGR